ncbi:cytochrome c oxidase assembly factor Coa1 family protein [Spongiimicrobium salis]|uniref:cytochrome c oxidase assembly factor Coa1 family protein n=1 Tax=Spongiimicrobium salis TaxID=1667022 RepID=UPI00374D133C
MNNELVPQPSWWKRNWKWVVPVGGCLTIIILFVVFLGSLFYGITTVMEESQPYEYAFELINQDEKIIELLGSPIEKDGMVQGSVNWNNGRKSSNLTIPIAGPKGKGTLYVDARGIDDTWTYDRIEVLIPDNGLIDLLETQKIE